MAMVYVGTYETPLWDTPNGSLGSGFYGLAPNYIGGVQAYYIEILDENRSPNQVGDIISTISPAAIVGKALANITGSRVFSDFWNDVSGVYTRKPETIATLNRLRSVKGEPPPADNQAPNFGVIR